jgi:hypothetical protein
VERERDAEERRSSAIACLDFVHPDEREDSSDDPGASADRRSRRAPGSTDADPGNEPNGQKDETIRQ